MSGETPSQPSEPPRQFTLRAVLTGMAAGAILSLCNLYTGLKVGWLMNMSITGALMSYGFWQMLRAAGRARGLGMLETNLSQTAASAAAAIGSAGLVAPIPALTMLTGRVLSWGELVVWTFSVCLVGIAVSIGLRRQMIVEEELPFPSGLATANTLREMYAHGSEAACRLWALCAAALFAGAAKIIEHVAAPGRLAAPGFWQARPGGALEKAGVAGITPANLGFALDPATLMYAVGALVGPRVGVSLLLGSLLAWGWLAPLAFEAGWVPPGADDPARSWYGQGLQWLLWPGVAMMVSSALASFAFTWKSIAKALRPAGRHAAGGSPANDDIMPRRWFLLTCLAVLVVSVILQVWLFSITAWIAALGVLLTFVLALVAARVSGETNIAPIGAMGKVTQLVFAVLAPGQPAANLMAANVTGGAASQCADMMHDLKTGHLLGAHPRPQFIAQVCGAFGGALAGCAGYLLLVKDPARQLLTDEWPAPAVAAWKAVAELFQHGVGALPAGAGQGMAIGAICGVLLVVLERGLPPRLRVWVPSATSIGLAFVIPAYNSLAMFLGAMSALLLGRWLPGWSGRFLIILASGLIAGESLAGVVLALMQIMHGR